MTREELLIKNSGAQFAPEFRIGQEVRIKALKISGTVLAFLWDSEGTQIKIVYWWDGNRKVEWVFPVEIEAV